MFKQIKYRFIISGCLAGLVVALCLTLCLCACSVANFSTHSTNLNSGHKICYVPLDTRPITYDYPVKLAKTYGVDVVYPDISVMTWFSDTGDASKIRDWLKQNCKGCDAIVVSAEQLVHGGLIQMRKASSDDGSREDAMALLRTIKTDNPNTKIYLSNVLMRTSNTVLDEASKVWWDKINEYSSLYYKAQLLNDAQAQARCNELLDEIPSDVMDTFLGARQVNHQVNLDCINLAHEGVIDKLFIYQEDCATQGIQTVEQNELLSKINEYSLTDKIMMANGTDEAGSELMMLAAKNFYSSPNLQIETVWIGGNSEFTAKYEDRPFKQNLAQHLSGLDIKTSTHSEDVLLILVPKDKQADSSGATAANGYAAYSNDELMQMATQIKSLIQQGKHCYLLDLDLSNGGNLEFMRVLGDCGIANDFYGYSGWNTACNSLGTLLAQIYASHGPNEHSSNSDNNKKLTQERILDDVVYQTKVRDLVKADLVAAGQNVFNITETDNAQSILEQKFVENAELVRQVFSGKDVNFAPKLRWPRTFEIEITIN